MGRSRLTQEIVIERIKAVHGDRFDLSLVEFKTVDKKIKVICKDHGVFETTPYRLINRKLGCAACSGKKQHTTEEFIKKAKEIHGDAYDYSKVDYKYNNKPVIVVCPEHGEWGATWVGHIINKDICPGCAGNKKLTPEDLERRGREHFGDLYDYSMVEKVRSHLKVPIKCNKHGLVFYQEASGHLHGKVGCPKCKYENASASRTKTREQFTEEARAVHGEKYAYRTVDYKSSTTEVEIWCRKHKEYFMQKPSVHLLGCGCPKCGVEGNSGESHYNYIDGKGAERNKQRGDDGAHSRWSKSVRKGETTCLCCGEALIPGDPKRAPQAHHLYGYWEYPEIRYDIENGVTLCAECHRSYHSFSRGKVDTGDLFLEYCKSREKAVN